MDSLERLHHFYQTHGPEAWLIVAGLFLFAWGLALWATRRRPVSRLQARMRHALAHPADVRCIWFLSQLETPSKLWLCGQLSTGATQVLASPEESAAVCVQLQAHGVPLIVGGPKEGWTIHTDDLQH